MKAMVAMAKKGPFSRKVGQEMSEATTAASSALGSRRNQGDTPCPVNRIAVI